MVTAALILIGGFALAAAGYYRGKYLKAVASKRALESRLERARTWVADLARSPGAAYVPLPSLLRHVDEVLAGKATH